VLEDGAINQYPQVEIYEQSSSSPILLFDLVHRNKGMYEAIWIPTDVGAYNALYLVYNDSGHTTLNTRYSREMDIYSVEVDLDIGYILQCILGLGGENSFRDNTMFDSCGQIISGRIRLFDSKIHAEAATDGGSETTGLIATYRVDTEWEGINKLKSYRCVKL